MRRARLWALALIVAFAIGSQAAVAKDPAAGLYYLEPDSIALSELLAPPPDPDSRQQQYDARKVAQALSDRTPEDVAQMNADAHRDVFVFGDTLQPNFDAAHLPLTAALFKHAGNDTEILIDVAKGYFARTRPAGVRQTHGSYPSGHAAFAVCTAILLSLMVPEKRSAIFARASIFAESRIIAGVHYPSDVQAGWISGTVIAQALLTRPKFLADFAAAKTEVRAALGLPPAP